ncbi:MAG: hypothetical protein LC795_21255 [Acidobacteria bacterium]|nr:hypothetical protein [Acidobacteriota bacterium]
MTRRVIMNIKPGSAAEFGRIVGGEVIPLLREQSGMRHDDTFISPLLSEAVLNTHWDTQVCSESYDRAAYPAADATAVSCQINERRVGAVTIRDLDGELRTEEGTLAG